MILPALASAKAYCQSYSPLHSAPRLRLCWWGGELKCCNRYREWCRYKKLCRYKTWYSLPVVSVCLLWEYLRLRLTSALPRSLTGDNSQASAQDSLASCSQARCIATPLNPLKLWWLNPFLDSSLFECLLDWAEFGGGGGAGSDRRSYSTPHNTLH